jgi:hypothetical protein
MEKSPDVNRPAAKIRDKNTGFFSGAFPANPAGIGRKVCA